MADTADTPDLGWFRQHPEANYRVRPPRGQAEVDEIARAILPAGANWEGGFQGAKTWRVLAIRLPLRRVARILTMAEPDTDGAFHVLPIALGERMAIT